MPRHQLTLFIGLVGAVAWLVFFIVVSGRARAARRCLSLGAARSGKGRARPRHGGGRRGGREGSGPPLEVRAGRAGRGRGAAGSSPSAAGPTPPWDAGGSSTDRRRGAAAREPRAAEPNAATAVPWLGRPRSWSSSRERALRPKPAIPALGAVLASGN